jgi:hypothetical protein
MVDTSTNAMTKHERLELYRDFLIEEGFRPRLDDNGNVYFKCEGRTMVIQVDEKDEEFFRLIYPNVWPIESDAELAEVKEASIRATTETKVAKVFPVGEDTWATIEAFYSPADAFKPIFRRCLSALRAGVKTFVASMEDSLSHRQA